MEELLEKDVVKTIAEDGTIEYTRGGVFHNKYGPAWIFPNGRKYWYLCGFIHRHDGPAIEWESGRKSYYLEGREMTEEEHRKWNYPSP